jgi:fructose-1-phosphate kinase PfkB-like protein
MASAVKAATFKMLAFGPNPALQKVVRFDQPITLGGVNRATSLDYYVGGKGQGVAMAVNHWSAGSSTVAHFLGGDSGSFIQETLAAAGVDQVIQPCAATTRTCTTLLHGQDPTELIDPSGSISSAELEGLIAKTSARIGQSAPGGGQIRGVALCGTSPPGADSLYASVARSMADDNVLLLLDGHKGVSETLATGRVDVLKINLDEAIALTGAADASAAARALLLAPGAPLQRPGSMVALTDGPRAARIFFKSGGHYEIGVPNVDCVNAIGAGDVCTGIFLHTLIAAHAALGDGHAVGEDVAADAFCWGNAAACARCMHSLPTEFERAEVEELRARIQLKKLDSAF